jgi:type VI secretion system secreted protein Hcp
MSFKRLSVVSTLVVGASFLLAAVPARAQNGGVMFVTSANAKGNATITEKQGSRVIEVKTIVSPRDQQSGLTPGKRESVSPRDPQSGLPTGQRQSGLPAGKRQWKPITIVKEIDSASPKLFQAFKQNEFLQVKVEFNPNGKTPKTIELQGASIANLHNVRQGNREVEEVELTYQKIEVTYSNGKKSYADDWEARP